MKFIIIMMLFLVQPILSAMNTDDYKLLEKKWSSLQTGLQFEYYFENSNENLFNNDEYNILSDYMGSIFNDDMELIRIISAKQHYIVLNLKQSDNDEFKYDPDFCFLYKGNIKELRLVYYCKMNKCVVDTIFNANNINFQYLLKSKNYQRYKYDKTSISFH